ncbi:MAG: DUF2309 family protein [Planctomycetaceae bacterium]|nr:DUF2309 family protein [Planctomycetaceae bacterium]
MQSSNSTLKIREDEHPGPWTLQRRIQEAILSAAAMLPANGLLSRFRYQNPLHGLEHLPFEQAVRLAADLHRSSPYPDGRQYREKMDRGEFDFNDVWGVLQQDCGQGPDRIAGLIDRFDLRLTLLRLMIFDASPDPGPARSKRRGLFRRQRDADPQTKSDSPVEWLDQFHPAVSEDAVSIHVAAMESVSADDGNPSASVRRRNYLRRLQQVCETGCQLARGAHRQNRTTAGPHGRHSWLRYGDILHSETGVDINEQVQRILVPLLARFLDQGQAQWQHGDRSAGLLRFFADLYRPTLMRSHGWLAASDRELERLNEPGFDPLASIEDSLRQLQIADEDVDSELFALVHALPGWTGAVCSLEKSLEWIPWPAPPGTLFELIALRLILERLAITHLLKTDAEKKSDQPQRLESDNDGFIESGLFPALSQRRLALFEQRQRGERPQDSMRLYLTAQVMGWSPERLQPLLPEDWRALLDETERFGTVEQCRILQDAVEARQRRLFLDAIAVHSRRNDRPHDNGKTEQSLQILCCTDPGSESLRRHLEELDAAVQTFGTPGFFGLDVNVRMPGESHFSPQVPTNVRARHFVQQLPAYLPDGTLAGSPQLQKRSRWRDFEFSSTVEHWLSKRWLTRLLFPQISRGCISETPTVPETSGHMQLDCFGTVQSPEQPGYTIDEMAEIVGQLLSRTGMMDDFAIVILVVGHVSHSCNNPWQTADNCTFCRGRSGGMNARILSWMANQHGVRKRLAASGLVIPESTVFVAVEHDTCGDTVEYFDVDYLTPLQQKHMTRAADLLDAALQRNAHERCRRFEEVPLQISCSDAVSCVEARATDLTQMLPESGLSGNAYCIIGRRDRTKGLFLDRRAFLASYDPAADDDEGTQLRQLLRMVIPTCADVNLQYYFGSLDPQHYSSGSKLSQSVISGIGVTCGPEEDLCVGLPLQMVEPHDPQRLTCVVETTPEILESILLADSSLRRLAENRWIFLAAMHPVSSELFCYRNGRFEQHLPRRSQLPEVTSSEHWYRGMRENLSFVSITGQGCRSNRESQS